MKWNMTLSILIVGLFFSFPAFSSGGGSGPGAKKFLEESEDDKRVSGQFVKMSKDQKVIFNLRSKSKSKRFKAEEAYLEEELPEVLEALVRSQNQGSNFQVIHLLTE